MERLVPVWDVRRYDNNECSHTRSGTDDTNAARDILKVLRHSMRGDTLPTPFLRTYGKFGKKLEGIKDAVATGVAKRRESSHAPSDET